VRRGSAHGSRAITLALVGLAGIADLAGCGSSTRIAGDQVAGDSLTIYASVPLHGASSVSGSAVLSGEGLALAAIRGRIGRYQMGAARVEGR
jgi:hypothetical protein